MRFLLAPMVCTFTLFADLSAAEGDLIAGFEPGVYAKIYPDLELGWVALPDAPSDVIRLDEVPNVEMQLKDARRGDYPNALVDSTVLALAGKPSAYAVELEGWFLAEQGGLYTFTAISDDPVDIFIEGKPIAQNNPRKDWKTFYKEDFPDAVYGWEFETSVGTAHLSEARWYHVVIIARQQYAPFGKYGNTTATSSAFNGASLEVSVTHGDEPAQPLFLYLPITD